MQEVALVSQQPIACAESVDGCAFPGNALAKIDVVFALSLPEHPVSLDIFLVEFHLV
jgi:hypothetical protein